MELIPSRASYRPDESVSIELGVVEPGAVARVWSGLEVRSEHPVEPGQPLLELGVHPRGGYGVDVVRDGAIVAATAFDVLDDPFERPRYGFLAKMDGEADPAAVSRFFRRLHLDLAQFYDWGYRHSELMPPDEHYLDPLGQVRDLSVVNALASALDETGTLPLGYSAVYAVGHDEVDDWGDALLLRADGEGYRLGEDFLVLLDPAHPRWLEHYTAQLSRALEGTTLRGFHLDQYGWPKFARRADGIRVDLAASYRALLETVRAAVPDARFMFNNVNDFGTRQTAGAPQDASYIEVWPPHETLGDLGLLAERTRALRPEHPPILSAYLSCFLTEPAERAEAAARLVMATAFSHGATHLLLGETGSVLVDPYYPRNHELTEAGAEAFVPWYDFLVRWGDLLLAPDAEDVTEFMTGGINNDIVLEGPEGVAFSTKAQPGTIWTRVVRTGGGLLVHLIDLRAQDEVAWDAGKAPAEPLAGLSLRLAPVEGVPAAFWAGPESDHGTPERLGGAAAGESVAADSLSAGQHFVRYPLPELRTWGFVFIPRSEYL